VRQGEGGLADTGRADQQNGVREPGKSLSEQLLADSVVPL
jgi:hypothetical protein